MAVFARCKLALLRRDRATLLDWSKLRWASHPSPFITSPPSLILSFALFRHPDGSVLRRLCLVTFLGVYKPFLSFLSNLQNTAKHQLPCHYNDFSSLLELSRPSGSLLRLAATTIRLPPFFFCYNTVEFFSSHEPLILLFLRPSSSSFCLGVAIASYFASANCTFNSIPSVLCRPLPTINQSHITNSTIHLNLINFF